MTSPQPHANDLWETALGRLELRVTRPNFDTWLRDTRGLRFEDDRLVVGAPTDFATEWLATRMKPLIVKTLAVIAGHHVDVVFEVVKPASAAPPPALFDPQDARTAIAARPAAASSPIFNPALTFDSFVVGEENRLAHAASLAACAATPVYNPVVIYGSVGLGKTHLLHAIGHRCLADGRSVVFVTAERFANDFAMAARDRSFQSFRDRYRACQMLLVDDLQFLEGKEHTQEEFFHTFNDLRDAGAQVVVSSDRQPGLLTGLDEKLRSRLAAGLVGDIHPPSFDTRLAIVRARAQREGLHMGKTVLELIASREVPNVRELEGGFNRVVAFAQLTPSAPFNDDLARRALIPFTAAQPVSPPSADCVINAVCKRFDVTLQDLVSKKRDRRTTYARHVLMYLLREISHCLFTDIGRILGGRDHSTVIHAIHRISSEVSTLPETRDDVQSLTSILTGAA